MKTVEGRPLDEHDLVASARRGNLRAYEEIVQLYTRLAFRTAYLITGSAADAEEAAQDGFVKAYRALGRFRDGAPFRPWLLQIVANEARNRTRTVRRHAALELRLAEGLRAEDVSPSPAAAVEAAEERASLLRSLNALALEDRRVVALRYFLDLSVAETATVLDLPEGTVKSRLSRALGRLRQRLETSDG